MLIGGKDDRNSPLDELLNETTGLAAGLARQRRLEARAGEGTSLSERIGDQERQSRSALIGNIKALCDQLEDLDEECEECQAKLEVIRAQKDKLEQPENEALFEEAEQRQQAELDVAQQQRREIVQTMRQALDALAGPEAVAAPLLPSLPAGPGLPPAPAPGLDGLLSLGPLQGSLP